MLHGAPIPFIAKLCAAAVVTTGAGVVTYEIAAGDERSSAVEVSADSDAAFDDDDALAFVAELYRDELPPEESEPEEPPAATSTDEHEDEAVDSAEEKKDEEEPKKDSATEGDHDKDEKDDEEPEKEPADTEAPELVILHPKDGSHHDDVKLVFEGETEPGAIVKAGPYAATVDAAGRWRIELILRPGANRAVFTAVDAAGNVADASVTVHLDVEPPKEYEEKEEVEPDPETVAFSANQQWGTCDDDVPYDVFWGTATPKSVVHIVSAHGSAEVAVDEHGHWEKKVWFETAPRNEPFVVVVEAVNGRAEFDFVATGGDDHHDGEKAD